MNGDIDPAFGPAWDETRGEPTYAPDLPRLSLKAVSALVGHRQRTIIGWLKSGSFPLRKVNGRYYWTKAQQQHDGALIASLSAKVEDLTRALEEAKRVIEWMEERHD